MKKAARNNLSTSATVQDQTVFATGAFKIVYKGSYTSGEREGQACVLKEFKSGSVYESSYFQKEMDVIEAAMNIIDRFNQSRAIDRHIYLNQPAVWQYTTGEKTGQKILVEPYIESFQKFNSNTGWQDRDGTPWNLVMQALSHFSYHTTGGSTVLCDLQGGIYSDGAVLTDPVVMSDDQKFGPTDLGRDGISTFFARHSCNRYCNNLWSKPSRPSVHFPEVAGSYMMQVPTRQSRPPLTHYPS
eukprot:Phypoly_transcript_13618.p1 GENE.Phypoly_transcript_13618~~Phypoly_transcript_13618.p1  ORF type:complete len:243 (+),score=23.24 Phypoly_transcript_13618:132-860(+)